MGLQHYDFSEKKRGMTLVFILIMAITSVVLRGLVVRDLWNWFISGPFEFTSISFPVALGIITLFSFLNLKEADMDSYSYINKSLEGIQKRMTAWIGVYLIIWGMGYIIQLFI